MRTGLVTGDFVVGWVARRTNEFGSFGGGAQALGWERDGLIVAGVVYADWNGPNVVCHIASDGSRRWLSREFLWTMFDYPFTQLKCQRITVTIGEGNTASRRFVEHLGFELEATLKSAHPSGDLLVYRLWRHQCRFLKAPYAKVATTRAVLLRAAA